jgi:hypothetical protein
MYHGASGSYRTWFYQTRIQVVGSFIGSVPRNAVPSRQRLDHWTAAANSDKSKNGIRDLKEVERNLPEIASRQPAPRPDKGAEHDGLHAPWPRRDSLREMSAATGIATAISNHEASGTTTNTNAAWA